MEILLRQIEMAMEGEWLGDEGILHDHIYCVHKTIRHAQSGRGVSILVSHILDG